MNWLLLSWRNLFARPLASLLSVLLIALGCGLISLLLLLSDRIDNQLQRNLAGIDMVVGAKGSPLQLLLSAVFQIDNPTGNISLTEAEKLMKHPQVKTAVPLAYGDNFKGFRIIGSEHSYPEIYEAKLAAGSLWSGTFDVTIGATVAERTGLRTGSEFEGTHGMQEIGEVHDHHHYHVTGIFEPTGTALDQLIVGSVEGVWAMHEHEGEDIPRELTALLVFFRSPMGMIQLPNHVNSRTNMQAALPTYEMQILQKRLGWGFDTLRLLAFAIIIVAALSIFVSLFNALKDRRYEIAVLRSMGLSRGKTFAMLLTEGLLLALIGFILGILLSRIGLNIISNMVDSQLHHSLSATSLFSPQEWVLLASALGLSLLAALPPAIQAMRIDIAKTLTS